MQSQGEAVTAVVTDTQTTVNVAMAEPSQAPERYALLMPIVQAPAPTVAIVAETSEEAASPVATIEPTALPIPTAILATVIAVVVTQPSPTFTSLQPPGVEPTLAPELAPEVVTVVITPPAVAALPTLLPAAMPPPATVDPQMVRLLGIIAAGGLLVALPMGLLVVAVVAYWIGRL